MLKYVDYDIVFQEFPDEVTMAINITNCPNRCVGCHSPQLRDNIGYSLNEEVLALLLEKYGESITCIGFMGGDADPEKIEILARFVKEHFSNKMKVGWYSGKNKLPDNFDLQWFDYIKLGPFIPEKGNLRSLSTNQRMFKIEDKQMRDVTYRFLQINII